MNHHGNNHRSPEEVSPGFEPMAFKAGQYAFVSFGSTPFEDRAHPFSFVSCEADLPQIAFTIKESGDLTNTVKDLKVGSKFLVSVARPKDLELQLKGLRRGRPLVHLGFSRPSDLAEFSDLGAALVEGRYVIGDDCQTVRGNFLITDPMRMLCEAANAPDERTAWLGHFLWLSDGDAGPEAPQDIEAVNLAAGDTIPGLFRETLDRVMTSRLNLLKKQPVILPLDTRKASVRWTAFLNPSLTVR